MSWLTRAQLGNGRAGQSTRFIAVAVVGLAGLVASAQVRYTPPTQQDGRLFDANPQVGASRYNYARPVSPLNVGEMIVTGNVRGGLAFRGYSPISSPTAFRGPLGSGSLAGFRRDSVSVADSASPYGSPLGTPYYDPARTVYTRGFLSGHYGQPGPQLGPLATGTREPQSPSAVPGPLDLRLDIRLKIGPPPGTGPTTSTPASLRTQIVGLMPAPSPELSSSIFGPMPRATAPSPWDLWRPSDPTETRESGSRDLGARAPYDRPVLEEPPGTQAPLGTPLELVRSGVLPRIPLEEGEEFFAPADGEETAVRFGPLAVRPEDEGGPAAWSSVLRRGPARAVPGLRDVSVLPGYDVFNDMQLALSLSQDPRAVWFEEMQAAIRENPSLAEMLQEQAQMQAQEFVGQMLQSPVETFHGRGDSALNNELLKAESLLEIGEYYEAVRRYEVAQRLDPLNPLPLIGKGNAFLAAGEYSSATIALVRGFERYPELVEFDFNLTALMGGREIVDIRRADIMRRLASRDDARLRFLLGYLEYYAGNRESGMANLERAAELDQGSSIISRFPAILRRESALPPPKLPDALQPVPEEPPGGPVPLPRSRIDEGRPNAVGPPAEPEEP